MSDTEFRSPSFRSKLFGILRRNLISERPEYADRDVILCPICQREMTLEDVKSVEHILPQSALKHDPTFVRETEISRRAGLTILCRSPRQIAGGRVAAEGCNGWKGQIYDRLFQRTFAGQHIQPESLTVRRYVAVLTMAYLATFQRFGYGSVLDKAFDTIRCQIDNPDQKVTSWLDYVLIKTQKHDLNGTAWATSSGLPFVFGWHNVKGSALEVNFRRFTALVPGGHWLVRHSPDLLLPMVIVPPGAESPPLARPDPQSAS